MRLAAAAWILVTVTMATSAHAFCRTTTEFHPVDPTQCPTPQGQPLAWKGGCASLSIDPERLPAGITRDAFLAEVTAATQRWSMANCGSGTGPSFHFVMYPDCLHGAEWNPGQRNANTVSFRGIWGDDEYHILEAIAVTITTFVPSTGEIQDSDTELNLQSETNPLGFTFTDGPANTGDADLPTVLTHEIGHAQGLAHSEIHDAVMWWQAGLGEQRRSLNPDDVAGICAIYPPGRKTSCDPNPPGGFTCDPGCGCHTVAVPPSGGPKQLGGIMAMLAVIVATLARRWSRHRDANRISCTAAVNRTE